MLDPHGHSAPVAPLQQTLLIDPQPEIDVQAAPEG